MRLSVIVALLMFLAFGSIGISAQAEITKEIQGGILNGKAKSLPKPEYSEDWKLAGIQGTVSVAVTIDEEGNVISAEPVTDNKKKIVLAPNSGATAASENYVVSKVEPPNPLLQESAKQAALKAKFSPTLLDGVPVKVKGVIIYNFSASPTVAGTGGRTISGGVLNGKALNLPLPAYPAAARAVGAGGAVSVQVLIDENGNIIGANAVSGHPLLRAAATDAALAARFSPTLLQGVPVKVSGILTYNFVP